MKKHVLLGSILAAAVAGVAVKSVPFDELELRLRSQKSVANQLGEELQKYPPLKALHDHYPEEYGQIVMVAAEGVKAGRSDSEVLGLIRPKVLAAYNSKAHKTSDELVGKQLDYALRQLRYLRGQDTRYCSDLVTNPAQLSFDLAAVMPRFMVEEEARLMAEAIADSAENSQSLSPRADEELVANLTEKALQNLSARELEALSRVGFETSRLRAAERASIECNFRIAILTELKAMPLSERANLFRSLS